MKNSADDTVAFQTFDQYPILLTMPIKRDNLSPRRQSKHAGEVICFVAT